MRRSFGRLPPMFLRSDLRYDNQNSSLRNGGCFGELPGLAMAIYVGQHLEICWRTPWAPI